ncbi:hypothetical protein TWF694_009006 [Orbilia ellipsospora]|uniref:Uncharacterized protein n=1 Tax=Orbilia ellipsospora TaxID=2528407 RepID=A0AAV9XGW6_9PEZI
MKVTAILATGASLAMGAAATSVGFNTPASLLDAFKRDHPDKANWPIVVACDRNTINGVNWDRERGRIETADTFGSARDCDITWCNPNGGNCHFKLLGDGGANNWWQQGWNRNNKDLCYPGNC